jgi:hypothetical protein
MVDQQSPMQAAANMVVEYVAGGLPENARFVLLVAMPTGGAAPDGQMEVGILSFGNAPKPVDLVRAWLGRTEENSCTGVQQRDGEPSSPRQGPVPGAG